MSTLPVNLYRAAQVREFDRVAIEECGIPGATLMERAGRAAFEVLRAHWPQARRVVVVCGTGNNGGDGFVVARLSQHAGLEVCVLRMGEEGALRADARAALEAVRAAGVEVVPFSAARLKDTELIVDALFGIGLDREVSGVWRDVIEAVNHAHKHVLALDIPSGLDADSGAVLGAAVRASVTISFLALKQGVFTGAALDYSGKVVFDDLGVPQEITQRAVPAAVRLTRENLPRLKLRARDSHKGDYGRVLVIGGDHGMAGAARLAAEAAARVGAGLVYVATRAAHASYISAQRPELLCYGVENAEQLQPLLEKADVIAIGPGLGQSPWALELFNAALRTSLPLIVDADALTLLAQHPCARANWILTPHPGEAGRLLNCAGSVIQRDRYHAVRELQAKHGGVAVLKGAGTLIAAESAPVGVCTAGNPGMASAGMGDVLTGVMAGLSAQGMTLADAARLGVSLHAQAGDEAAQRGERGLLASDLFAPLRALVNRA
ncbi:MAG: NAD(P)H-hydrate dehydratase [Gammaproteobacteria bacterium]|nr:MAG: NAD(P)H-hydrate dehydratase [Gammaproteobacteria bacterium]